MMELPLFRSILRPISRVLVGLIAIPIFRFLMRKVFRLQELDDELEKDLEEWFRGALLLLAASANMEHLLFGWMQKVDWLDRADWLTMGLRLMLAISVIEAMPDQELFAVLHPGPPKIAKGKKILAQVWQQKWLFGKGILCRHLNRSSPVLAMMCAIIGGQLPTTEERQSEVEQYESEMLEYNSKKDQYKDEMQRQELIIGWAYCQQCSVWFPAQEAIALDALQNISPVNQKVSEPPARPGKQRERWLVGWVCYLMAITQYLIIGLVTSRDRALDVLSEFDRVVAERRIELIEEFKLEGNLPPDFTAKTVPMTTPSTDEPVAVDVSPSAAAESKPVAKEKPKSVDSN